MDQHTAWYLARAGGLVAWALASATVVWGLTLAGRPLARRVGPAWLYDLHQHLGALAVVFTAVHVVSLIADSTVEFSLLDVLVPWASSWRPTAVALGVLAAWLLLAVQVTSWLRRRLPKKLWRWTHQASLPLWILATAHLLMAGTDTRNAVTFAAAGVVAAVVSVLAVYRASTRRPPIRALPARTT